MSGAMALMARLEAAGVVVELSADGAGLDLQAAAAPPPALLAEMRRLKPEIVRLLADRAANDALLSPLFGESEGGISASSARLAPADDPTEIETLALALMAEAERRLDLYRRRAAEAVAGDDPERAAIQAEETAVMMPAERHAAIMAALLLAASPLAGTPGARPCRSCGRGIWCSPSWVGPPPDLCFPCSREGTP